MIVFSILQVPMAEWDLGPHAQDLFDAVFNYFPITFKPPPGDPYGITAQDLKDRLRDCVAATSDFAPYAFPALLDKLDSSSMNTKRDVLAAILACVESYEPRTVSLYSVTLWDALKFEILNVQEEDLAQESLTILSTIAVKLALAGEGALNAYLKPIIKECNEHLEDAPTKQSKAAGSILNAVAKASPIIADILTKAVLPHLFQLFQSSESISKRRGLIEVLNQIIDATIAVSSQWRTTDADGIITGDRATSNALRDYSSESLEALLRAVINAPKSEVSFRLSAIEGLVGLVKVRELLNDADVVRVIDACTDIIIHERDSAQADVEAAAIKGLTEIAHHSPSTTAEKALPTLLAQLPDAPETTGGYERILEAFAKLSTETQIFDTIVLRLKNKLNAAVHQKAQNFYIHALLTAILFAFANGSPGTEDGTIRSSYFPDIIKPFLDQATASGNVSILSDETSIDIIGRTCNIIIRQQSTHIQNQIFVEYEPVFALIGQENAGKHGNTAVIASLHLHAAFRQEAVTSDVATILLDRLASVAKSQHAPQLVRLAALRHASLVTNKFIPSASLEQTLAQTKSDSSSLLGESRTAESIMLAFAIAKGLVVQGKSAKYASAYIQSLLQLLSDSVYGDITGRGFVTLLAVDDIIVKENHCNISGLYKQRTFSQTVPAISAATKEANPLAKPNYLVALSGILRWLPYSIIESSLTSIVLLLLQSLDLKEQAHQDVKAATLSTLEIVITESPDSLAEHAPSFISRLLACTTAPRNNTAVRRGALRCLMLLPTQFKLQTVVPYRRQVVKQLMACLDDKRRVVRAEAVRCRTAWLAIEQEDEDDD